MNKKLVVLLLPVMMQATVNQSVEGLFNHLNPKNFADLQATTVAFIKVGVQTEVRNGADKAGRQIAQKWCDRTLLAENKITKFLIGGGLTTQDAAAFVARALASGAWQQAAEKDKNAANFGKRTGVHALTQLLYSTGKRLSVAGIDLLGFTPVENLKLNEGATRVVLDVAEGLAYDVAHAAVIQAFSGK